MVAGLGAGLGDLIGGITTLADPPDLKKYSKQELELWRALGLPQYSEETIPWQQLLLQGELDPGLGMYDPVISGDVSTIQEDPALRESQLRAMLGFERVGREGLPLQDRLLADEAQRAVAGEFGRANEGIMRDFAARGRGGGGTELAARLQASGAGAELARGLGSDLAQMSIQNRLMGMREAGGMAGDIRGMDARTAALNSEMQNRWNQWLSGLQTTAAQNAARARDEAQRYNLGNRQRLHEENVLGGYGSRLGERQRQDDLQDRGFEAAYRKTLGQAGALENVALSQADREAAKAAAIKGIGRGTGSILDSLIAAKAGGAKGAAAQSGAGGGLGYTTADDYRLASYR